MPVDTSAELQVASDVERQLVALRVNSQVLLELPIAPLRGVADLVRLELALRRFAQVHRSKRSKALVRTIRAILLTARDRLRKAAAAGFAASARQIPFRDTQPAA
jgi:hypothetical protein